MNRYRVLVSVWMVMFATHITLADYEHLIGETGDAVKAELGEPEGMFELGPDKQIFVYAQGRVTLEGGQVVGHTLLSPMEFKEKQAKRQETEEYWKQRQAEFEKERVEAGERLREQTLKDPDFLAMTYGDQLRFWKSFKVRYPEVDVEDTYHEVLEKYKELIAEEQKSRRLVELKKEVAQAHERVAEAERKAEEARNRRPNNFFYYSDPVYPRPIMPYRRVGSGGSQVSIGYNGNDWNFSLSSGSFLQPAVSHVPTGRPITIIRTD